MTERNFERLCWTLHSASCFQFSLGDFY